MLVNTKKMLEEAFNKQYAICQFNINNLEWTKFILEECQKHKSPVILGVSSGAATYMGGFKTIYNIVEGLIQDLNITIPVALHLDHGSNFEICKKAIDAGFTSVMIDASQQPLEENIRITKQVVEYATQYNVTVEAELGHIGGEEDGIRGDNFYANPKECQKMIQATKIDTLAPAIGSVHGLYKDKPNLQYKLIKEIKEKTNTPLVLHGASGISDHDIKKALQEGIAKININTDLQIAWSKEVRLFLKNNSEIYDPRKIIKSGEKALKEIVKEKIRLTRENN